MLIFYAQMITNAYILCPNDHQCLYRIQVFDQNGGNLCSFGGGVLNHLTGICVDKDGRVIVTVFGNHRVEVFDKT